MTLSHIRGRSDVAVGERYLEIIRDPWYRCLIGVQDLISFETARFWRERSVRCLHLPITTGSISSPMGLGSDSTPVQIDLFGVPTYLADSMQFMLEYGCRLTEHGCYYLMPSFRGEPADATHLNQFFHSEAEIPGSLDTVMAVAEEYVRWIAAACLEQFGGTLDAVAGATAHIQDFLGRPTARLSFDEAAALLGREPGSIVDHGTWRSITRRGEQNLIERLGPAVWLTHFDSRAVPFYQARSGRQALNADLLLGPGEVIGAGERHLHGDDVIAAMHDQGVDESDYGWYVDLKSTFPMRTSGFGLGVERLIMWLMRCPDIRQVQLVERYNGIATAP